MDDDPLQKKALSSFKWNKAKLDAVHLLADDELTDQEIADKVSVRRNTLWVWKKNPVFAAKLKEETEHLGDVAQRYAIGRRSRRLAAQNNRWERMQRLVEERSQAAEMQDATGGKTGLLTRDQKSIGGRDNAEKVDVYQFDAALVKEIRELEKQAAIECGQWTEKREHSLPDLETALALELSRLAAGRAGAVPPDGQGTAADDAGGEDQGTGAGADQGDTEPG